MGQGRTMMRYFRSSLIRCPENKPRRRKARQSASRGERFRAVGWEQLEGRVLLTAAATITWTGGSATSADWNDPANWDLGRAPIDGDSLVFPASAQQLTNSDDIAGLSVNSITFQGTFAPASGGYRLGGDDLTLGAGGIVDNATGGPSGTTIAALANEIDLQLNLTAAQNWSNSGSPSFPLVIVGNVANGGFTLTAVGSGTIDVSGQMSGSGGLAVSGPTLDLQNQNTYTGPTLVQGMLIVDGSTAAASAVTVAADSTLGGAGTVGGKITVMGPGGLRSGAGGTLSPGAGPDPSTDTGTLSNTGGVTFEPSTIVEPGAPADSIQLSEFAVQLGGTAARPTNDQLDSAGTVSFVDATGLHLTALAGAGPFDAGQQFVIVQAGAPITTTFDGLPEGSTVSDGAQNFTISYANDRVTLTAQPLTATTSTYINGQVGDGTAATFVHNLYRELLGREPDAAGQTFWVNVFDQADSKGGTAAAQQTLVAAFLSSAEYRQHLVEGIYANLLHRAADASGLAFWTAELAAGMDEKNMLADIAGSDEYVNDAGSLQGWINALYRDFLGRPADSGGLAFWTRVAGGPTGFTDLRSPARNDVAFLFLSTPEANHKLLNGDYPGAAGAVGGPGTPADGAYALANLTGNGWDNLYFQGSLSAAEVDTLFAQLQAGESYDQTIAGMLDMSQYFGPAVTPF
jgi:hypothetical protein